MLRRAGIGFGVRYCEAGGWGRADVIACIRTQGFNHSLAGALYMCPPAAVIVPP